MTHPRIKTTLAVLALLLAALTACNRAPASAAGPGSANVRLYAVSTIAGAVEPCGCQKDMLGGVDHAAALVGQGDANRVVVGAGPMLFMDPTIDDERRTQDLWKAEAMAASFATLGLIAWAPGVNDWALGAETLQRLARRSGATLLAANLSGQVAGARQTLMKTVGGHKVGLTGVCDLRVSPHIPAGLRVGDPAEALRSAAAALRNDGAQILVALVAAERGEALRLAERVTDFDVLVVGKPFDRGEANDAPASPVLVGRTLVLEAPNHLQAIGVVDLVVRGDYDFRDGSGLHAAERRGSLERRISELEKRIVTWEKQGGVSAQDLQARRQDLSRLRAELAKLERPEPPAEGSYFRYTLREVREALGSVPAVAQTLSEYYRRVNDHNRQAFADRKPPPVEPGQSHYLGVEDCANCHEEEHEFWKKTQHAKAYETLTVQHKEFNLDCVSCHVTGYEKPGGSTVTHVAAFKDVQCEVCHGPGSRHEDDPKNPTLIVASPSRSLCAGSCHHPPHVNEGWSVDEAWKHIVGPGHGE